MRNRLAALLSVLALTSAVLTAAATTAADAGQRGERGRHGPDRIELPTGWQPEGITTDGKKLYAGSLRTGELLRANPRNGRFVVLPRSEAGPPAVGVDHDERRDLLWVAGGPTGEIRAQSASSGRLLRTYTSPRPAGFVNDLVVTRDAVYATDSVNQRLLVVPLDARRLPRSGRAEARPLTGDLSYSAGFNANGVVVSGDHLVLVQSNEGLLFRVDPDTGATREIDLDGYLVSNGDGLELDHDTLYVVRNTDNLIAVVDLADDLLSGDVVEELHSDDFDVPTTVALLRHSLYAVNARFGVTSPATQDYWITRVDEPRR